MTYQKSKTKLKVAVWLILFFISINATANDDVELWRDEKAPFSGVLVSPDRYQDYAVAVEQRDAMRVRIIEEIDEKSTIDPWTIGIGGFVLGLAAPTIIQAILPR